MTEEIPPSQVHRNSNASRYLSIPNQLNDPRIHFIKVQPRGKEAIEKGWTTTKNYSIQDPEIVKHIQHGGNYGVTFFDGSGASIDADTPEIQDALETRLPRTFRYSTGKEGHYQYVFFVEDGPIGCYPLKDGAFIKGKGGYALGPGSIHPNGTEYGSREIRDAPIATITKGQLLSALNDFLLRKPDSKERPQIKREGVAWLSLGDLIDLSKFRKSGSRYQGPHPIHGSKTGLNLSIDLEKNVWHCFRHDSGGSVLEWIAVKEGIIDCAEAIPRALRGEKFWKVLEVAHEKYGLTKKTAVKIIKKEVSR
jgi:hypothetical protein